MEDYDMNEKRNRVLGSIIILGVITLMLFSLCACSKNEFAINKISVVVKTEYHEKFANKNFTNEDFGWDNIDKVEYGIWHDSTGGPLTIYLKKQGKKEVLAAVEHFKSINAIQSVNPCYIISIQ